MAYQIPSVAAGALRLHYNENTAGCSPAVLEALHAVTREDVSLYPDYGPITARTERWFGVDAGWVQLTNGLDEGLQVVAQCGVWHTRSSSRAVDSQRSAAEIVIVEPAFEMYAECAAAVGAAVVGVPPEADFSFPLARVIAAISPATRVIYLTDPNNPTGVGIPAGAIDAVAAAAPHALVLVDEAYGDFSGRTSIGPLLDTRRNLIVGRTFAKAHGLAALRLGALVAHPDTLDRLRVLLAPFSVNILAIKALAAALDDREYLKWSVAQSVASRDRIYAFCRRRGLHYWRSDANFVLFRVDDAAAIVAAMRDRGIIVRDKSAAPGCAGCIRMTAGVVEHTAAALAVLEEILASRQN